MASKRILSLEAYRGFAALVVLIYHYMLAFAPSGVFTLPGTPVYILFNGNAAVIFFFVLSGTLNSRSMLKDNSVAALVRGLARRWPRLMLPSLLASLFAWALYALGAYNHEAAGALSGSKWLADFANAGHAAGFQPSFVDAVLQGAVTVFVTQHSDYVPPLWTMHFELIGTVLVLLLAFVMTRLPFRLGLAVAVLAAVAVAAVPPHYGLPFTVGLTLSYVMHRLKDRRLPDGAMAVLFALSLYLFMYDKPVGLHAFFYEPDSWFWMETQRIVIQCAGAAGLVYTGLNWPKLAELLSGRFAAWAGEMALPVFLLHSAIYCSLASWVLVWAEPRFGYTVAAGFTLVAGVLGTLPPAWVFTRIDRAWGPVINRLADSLVARIPLPAPKAA